MSIGGGLDGWKPTEEAEERALACLRLFGERVAGLPGRNVRAVGTNTLRKAKDVVGFLSGRERLVPDDVISGREKPG